MATHELGTRAPPVLPAAVQPVKISLHDCLAVCEQCAVDIEREVSMAGQVCGKAVARDQETNDASERLVAHWSAPIELCLVARPCCSPLT